MMSGRTGDECCAVDPLWLVKDYMFCMLRVCIDKKKN